MVRLYTWQRNGRKKVRDYVEGCIAAHVVLDATCLSAESTRRLVFREALHILQLLDVYIPLSALTTISHLMTT